MNIEWTNCSEQMPPDNAKLIVTLSDTFRTKGYEYNIWQSDELKKELMDRKFRWASHTLWTPFTQEKWEFLNK
jgi:hypothetical protein